MSLPVFLSGLDPDSLVRRIVPAPASARDFFALCERRPETPCKLAVHREGGRTIGHFVDQVSQGRTFIDLDAGQVTKRVTGFAGFDTLGREARWLTRLAGCERVPVLHGVSGDCLRMSYLGEPLRRHNLPPDWPRQAEEIIAALRAAGCSHNDIKCDNIVVRDGRMALIDFGWSTPLGAPIPADWPEQLGAQHRLAVHVFDDARAIRAACRAAAAGRVRPSRKVVA